MGGLATVGGVGGLAAAAGADDGRRAGELAGGGGGGEEGSDGSGEEGSGGELGAGVLGAGEDGGGGWRQARTAASSAGWGSDRGETVDLGIFSPNRPVQQNIRSCSLPCA